MLVRCNVIVAIFAIALTGSCWREQAEKPRAPGLMESLQTELESLHTAITHGDKEGLLRWADELERTVSSVTTSSDQLWPHWETLRDQTQKLEDAQCVEDAAAALGLIAKGCGDCHRESGSRVAIESTAHPLGPGSATRMRKHSWSMDLLRRGLIGPSDAAWLEGTSQIINGDFLGLATGSEAASASERLHALGEEAYNATTSGQKARFYGRMMSECVGCHAQGRDQGTLVAPRSRCTPLKR